MRALAEFIMRGRTQACAVALLGSLFPLVSPATVGLVTLRKGSSQGLLVLLWALLPLIANFFLSQGSHLLPLVSMASLAMMLVSANVLRLTVSWQWTMMASMLVAAAVALAVGLVFGSEVELLIEELNKAIAEVTAQQDSKQTAPFIAGPQYVLGLIALVLAASAIVSLFVSRWWQALLYNPGGFSEEFHSLRLDSKVAAALLIVVILGSFLPRGYEFWAGLMAIPLLIAGIALVHHSVRVLKLNGAWLGFMYFGLLVFGPMVGALLVGLSFADSMVNLRSRLAANNNRQP